MNTPHLVGVKPDTFEPAHSYPVIHCHRCGAACVVAFDGRFEEEELTDLHARSVNFDPMTTEPRHLGDVVLWFAVDGMGHPLGRQRFTRLGDLDRYNGSVWQYHRNTCGQRQLTIAGVK
jgi:hypothetical protein